MGTKEAFIKWCKSKGIESVNEHTVFRWDEVIDFANQKTQQQQEIIRRLRAVLGEAYRERKEIYETDKATINWFDVKKPSWLMLAKTILKELE